MDRFPRAAVDEPESDRLLAKTGLTGENEDRACTVRPPSKCRSPLIGQEAAQ